MSAGDFSTVLTIESSKKKDETSHLPLLIIKAQFLPGNLTELWNMTILYGKTHDKWPFSIAISRG